MIDVKTREVTLMELSDRAIFTAVNEEYGRRVPVLRVYGVGLGEGCFVVAGVADLRAMHTAIEGVLVRVGDVTALLSAERAAKDRDER